MECSQAGAATASTGAAGMLRILACGNPGGGMSVLIRNLLHGCDPVPGAPLQEAIGHNAGFGAAGDGGLAPTPQAGDEPRTGAA